MRGIRRWAGPAAVVWTAIYAALGAFWALGGPGWPFGPGDPARLESNLGGVSARAGGTAFAVIGLAGVVVGVLALSASRARRRIAIVLPYGALLVVLLLVAQDRRLLMALGYLPILLGVGLWSLATGSGFPDMSHLGAWTMTTMVSFTVGGFLWLGLLLRYAKTIGLRRPAWATPGAARRWGRWTVGIAVAAPCAYAATRLAWALGLRLGISEEFYREGVRTGLWWIGASLASLGIVGAVLTLGLVQRWGEVYPRWIWWRRGRPVPVLLAVVPASLVSVFVTSAGVEYWRLMLTGAMESGPIESSWATMGPELLWPVWGLALAASTLAYYLRRTESAQNLQRVAVSPSGPYPNARTGATR